MAFFVFFREFKVGFPKELLEKYMKILKRNMWLIIYIEVRGNDKVEIKNMETIEN